MDELANKLKDLRRLRNLSQQEVAEAMGFSRPTYALVEGGIKDLTLPELERLAGILDTSLAELLFGPKMVHTGRSDAHKYNQMLLNCLYYGIDKRGIMTKRKLGLVMFLADYTWYKKTGTSITGMDYMRMVNGPVPDQFYWSIDDMYDSGFLDIELRGSVMLVVPLEVPANDRLSKGELIHIKETVAEWRDRPTSELVTSAHMPLPWQLGYAGAFIPYELLGTK